MSQSVYRVHGYILYEIECMTMPASSITSSDILQLEDLAGNYRSSFLGLDDYLRAYEAGFH